MARTGSAAQGSHLRPGEVVQVELEQATGKGEGVVRMAGQLLRAVFPGELPQGARVAMQVVRAGPPLVLQVADPGAEALARLPGPPAQGLTAALAVLLGTPAPGEGPADLLHALRHLLQLPQDPAALARGLAAWVTGSGVFHEALLARGEAPADLKTILLQLLPQLAQGPMREAAEALLGHLQAHQARSVLEDQAIVPLLLPWGDEWVQGEIRLHPDDRGGAAGQEGCGTLQVNLDMPRLGRVEVAVRWTENGVSARIAADPRGLEPLRRGLDELGTQLAEHAGVRLLSLSAGPLPPPAGGGGPAGLLEVRA